MQEFNDEQQRVASNLEQAYEAFKAASIERTSIPCYMIWKLVNKTNYLYSANPTEKSLGRESDETLKVFEEFTQNKLRLEGLIRGAQTRLDSLVRQYRALRLPLVMSLPAKILRDMDLNSILGGHFKVVGSMAMPIYEIESGVTLFSGIEETEDLDISWTGRLSLSAPRGDEASSIFSIARGVDKSFDVSMFYPQKLVNKDAFEIDILCSKGDHFKVDVPSKRRLFGGLVVPVELDGQDILHLGSPIRHIAVGRNGTPAPMVVPDPRFMALHKFWLSEQSDRSALKRKKDSKQARILLDACSTNKLWAHPIDDDFVEMIPAHWTEEWDRFIQTSQTQSPRG